ncbi:MAG: hypothetical protein ACRDQW_13410 [Haloechinothrix sp.]
MMPDPAAQAADPNEVIGLGDAPQVTADAYFEALPARRSVGSTVEAEIVR